MTLGYPGRDMVLGLKGQGHKFYKCIFHTNGRAITWSKKCGVQTQEEDIMAVGEVSPPFQLGV